MILEGDRGLERRPVTGRTARIAGKFAFEIVRERFYHFMNLLIALRYSPPLRLAQDWHSRNVMVPSFQESRVPLLQSEHSFLCRALLTMRYFGSFSFIASPSSTVRRVFAARTRRGLKVPTLPSTPLFSIGLWGVFCVPTKNWKGSMLNSLIPLRGMVPDYRFCGFKRFWYMARVASRAAWTSLTATRGSSR